MGWSWRQVLGVLPGGQYQSSSGKVLAHSYNQGASDETAKSQQKQEWGVSRKKSEEDWPSELSVARI